MTKQAFDTSRVVGYAGSTSQTSTLVGTMAFYLFHTHDPRGETVVLWENRYHNHIRKHEGITVAMIQTAVEEPEIINPSCYLGEVVEKSMDPTLELW